MAQLFEIDGELYDWELIEALIAERLHIDPLEVHAIGIEVRAKARLAKDEN